MSGQLDRKQQQRLFGGLLVGVLAVGGVSIGPAMRRPPRPISSGATAFVTMVGDAEQDHAAALAALHQPSGSPGLVVTCRGTAAPLKFGAEARQQECQASVLSWVPAAPPPGASGCTVLRRLGRHSTTYADAGGACSAAVAATPPQEPVVAQTGFGADWQRSDVLVPPPTKPAGDYALLVSWTKVRTTRNCGFGLCTDAWPS